MMIEAIGRSGAAEIEWNTCWTFLAFTCEDVVKLWNKPRRTVENGSGISRDSRETLLTRIR